MGTQHAARGDRPPFWGAARLASWASGSNATRHDNAECDDLTESNHSTYAVVRVSPEGPLRVP